MKNGREILAVAFAGAVVFAPAVVTGMVLQGLDAPERMVMVPITILFASLGWAKAQPAEGWFYRTFARIGGN